ncbi:transcription factor binding protein [Aureococcus anophagefferens]|nr:transcription factor binding protein [Aureococcus anophagefferens]
MKLLALALLAPAAASGPPDGTDAVALSRWMAAKLTWGTLSTTSTRSNGSQNPLRASSSRARGRPAAGSDEYEEAYAALEAPPYFKELPSDHDFYVAKMTVTGVWLIGAYGGVLAAAAPAPLTARPWFWNHVAVARWMAETLDWGVLSTTSTRTEGTAVGDAFGNPYSFAEVGGVPYFYGSTLDASMTDAFAGAGASPRASLSLSEAELSGDDELSSCRIGAILGDPENPPCARLVLSGALVNLDVDALFFIDMFGGADYLDPAAYLANSTTA